MQQQGSSGFVPLLQQFAVDCHVTQQYRSALEVRIGNTRLSIAKTLGKEHNPLASQIPGAINM